MEGIFRISDDITVFRDGEYVGTDRAENLTPDKLIQMMVGREMNTMFPKVECPIGDVVLKVENLSSGNAVQNVSFELRRGEILGFAGLVGAGRTETMEAIFGLRRVTGGPARQRDLRTAQPGGQHRHRRSEALLPPAARPSADAQGHSRIYREAAYQDP